MVLGTCQKVVERLFRSVLLATNMSSYVQKRLLIPISAVTSRTRLLYHFFVDSLASPVA